LGGVDFLNRKSIDIRWKSFAPNIEMIKEFDTRYQNIGVGKIADQISIYSNGKVLTSFPDEINGNLEANLIACQHPSPKSVLIFGAGAENLLKQLLANGISKIDYVETDHKLIEQTFYYQSNYDSKTMNNPAINRIAEDARVFVKDTTNKYDLIIINYSDPSTALINRFYTKEFFEQISKIMSLNGVMTMTITSAVNYLGDEVGLYVGTIYNTLKIIFPQILILPGDTARIFVSKKSGIISSDWNVLKERYFKRGLSDKGKFSPLIFKTRLNNHRIMKFQNELAQFESIGINSDRQPVTFYYNLLLWDQFSDKQATSTLKALRETGVNRVIEVVFFIELLMTVCLALGKRKWPEFQRSGRSAWLIFCTGLSVMGLELVVLFSFQNVHGALYEKIGLLVALFMGGLTLGGWFITKKLEKIGRNSNKYLLFSEGIIICVAFFLAKTTGEYLPGVTYYFITIIIGIGAGIQFPLAAYLAAPDNKNSRRTAALIDWADHFGAFFGAALTGVFFIPIFGLMETCMIILVIKSLGLISVWLSMILFNPIIILTSYTFQLL